MTPIFQQAKSMQEQIVQWRRALHRIPETGLILPQTAAFVKARLDEMGIAYQEYQGHSGITAVIGSGERTVALRADMDALLIAEETQLPFAADNGNMHACGHDAHTAMLLAAAQLLKQHVGEINGRVKLIFQPAEEGPGGAEPMLRDGVLDDVAAIFALHIGDLAGHFPAGSVAVSYAETTAADDQLLIEIKGKGGHGSTPQNCVDPVVVAATIVNNLQTIVSREVSAQDAVVITIAGIEAGRGAFNIIPESATLRGTIRNASTHTREFVFRRIREIATSTAKMLRAECTVEFLDGYPALINDRAVVESFLATAHKVLSEDEIFILPHGIMGGEDAGFFFEKCSGCFFFLPSSMPCPADQQVYGAHHPRFCIDESVFYRGAGLLAQSAVDWLDKA